MLYEALEKIWFYAIHDTIIETNFIFAITVLVLRLFCFHDFDFFCCKTCTAFVIFKKYINIQKTILKRILNLYFRSPLAVIFVIDSTNTERLSEAHDELSKLLAEKRLEDALILIYANKQVSKIHPVHKCFYTNVS